MASSLICIGLLASLLAQQPATAVTTSQKAAPALRIVVIAGEDSVNVIQQKTAVAPIIEVRDRNNLPVAGATVTFAVGPGASFGGASTLTVATNAAGQAVAAGLTPTVAGTIQIQATAVFQGQTATVAIAQSNVLTAAAANAAGAGGTSAGVGIGIGKIIAIVGGIGAAGAGVAVASGGSTSDSPTSTSTPTQSPTTTNPTTPIGGTPTAPPTPAPTTPAPPVPNRAPVIASASISPSVALVGANTTIAFQVQASDADNDTLTYVWEFPDGTTTNQPAFTRVFQHGGVYTIRVNVGDGKTSTRREMTLDMKTMIGGWIVSSNLTLSLNQSGSSIFGTYRTFVAECPMTGSIRSGGFVTLQAPRCPYFFALQGVWYEYPQYRWELQPSTDGNNFVGTMYVDNCRDCNSPNSSGPTSLRRQ